MKNAEKWSVAEVISALENYDIDEEDLVYTFLGCSIEDIQPVIILAPYWNPSLFLEVWPNQLEIVPNRVWKISLDKIKITYIRTGIGAPLFGDVALLLTLPSIHCEKVIFLGSVGGLSPHLSIGDLVLPTTSVSGAGFSRYLNRSKLANGDRFGAISIPNKELQNKLKDAADRIVTAENANVKIHQGNVFTADTIVAQFLHLDEIREMNCIGIEMETAVFFDIMKTAHIPTAALLLVSDNSITKKTLFSGRSAAEREFIKTIKKKIIPLIVSKAISNND